MVAPAGRLQVEDIAAREVHHTIIPDPGNGGTIDVSRGGVCNLTSVGAAETRSLPDPWFIGQKISFSFIADAGDIIMTAVSPVNQTGNVLITFDDIGEWIELAGAWNVTDGWEWKVIGADGATRS